MDKVKHLIPQILILVITFLMYFYLRVCCRESVFFDFDMPRVALIAQDFIKSGTYLTSQSYVQESVWKNIPWGPSLIYFYSFFLNISSDPLVVSDLLTIFNFIGIITIVWLGWKFFSPNVGVFSGLLLSTNFYWVTYSRIIYQPSQLVTFQIIAMLLTIISVREKNNKSIFFLPIVWVILFQIYIPTYAFIFVSLFYMALNYKNLNIKYFALGIIFSSILLIPTLYYYSNNPIYFERFINAPKLFTPPEKTFAERLYKVVLSYFNIPVGGYLKWQTGYAYNDFVNSLGKIKVVESMIVSIFIFMNFFIFKSSFLKAKNILKQMVFSWSFVVVLSLMVLWVTDLLPRYFLIAIPPAMLLISIGINDLIIKFNKNTFVKCLLYLLPLFIALYWTVLNIKYDNFVRDYGYPYGKMYDVAETPYMHFINAVNFINYDAKNKNCNNYYVSNDLSDLRSVWMETDYVYRYVTPKILNGQTLNNINDECIYFLVHNNLEIQSRYGSLKNRRYGPFFIVNQIEK